MQRKTFTSIASDRLLSALHNFKDNNHGKKSSIQQFLSHNETVNCVEMKNKLKKTPKQYAIYMMKLNNVERSAKQNQTLQFLEAVEEDFKPKGQYCLIF